jgi:hypothetical protein
MRFLRLIAVQILARLCSVPISIRSEFYGAERGCSEIVLQPRLAIAAESVPSSGSAVGDD